MAVDTASYSVTKPGGVCYVSGTDIAPGTLFHSALRDTDDGLQRVDVLPESWASFDRTGVIAHWQATMPEPTAKKKLLVDDAVLCDLFDRLGDADGEDKRQFRFVLGLILMRKRLLAYDGTEGNVWQMHWTNHGAAKAHDGGVELHDPKLTQDQIADVSVNLGEILNAEL
ncbi:MAG: hypothetical protein AAF656_12935, partial [Planctomycetota bacterium]